MSLLRISLAAVVAVLGNFGLVGAAQAADPVTFALPGTSTAGRDGYCSFPVTIVLTSDAKTRPGPIGVTTGNGSATVRNDLTGKTLQFNVSGPGKVASFPDGSFSVDAGGTNLFWTSVANSAPGVPPVSYTTGRLRFTVAASGATTAYSLSGRRTDVCAALA